MATVKITNISPLGDLDVPIIGRIVKAGESVEVSEEIAGHAPDASLSPDDPGVYGRGLLAQVSNWTLEQSASSPSKKSQITLADPIPPVVTEGE